MENKVLQTVNKANVKSEGAVISAPSEKTHRAHDKMQSDLAPSSYFIAMLFLCLSVAIWIGWENSYGKPKRRKRKKMDKRSRRKREFIITMPD